MTILSRAWTTGGKRDPVLDTCVGVRGGHPSQSQLERKALPKHPLESGRGTGTQLCSTQRRRLGALCGPPGWAHLLTPVCSAAAQARTGEPKPGAECWWRDWAAKAARRHLGPFSHSQHPWHFRRRVRPSMSSRKGTERVAPSGWSPGLPSLSPPAHSIQRP